MKEEVNAGTDIEPIVALDLIMPNGKRMRDCTAAEMKRFGDFLIRRRDIDESKHLFQQTEHEKRCTMDTN
jgi:hypothetical protein